MCTRCTRGTARRTFSACVRAERRRRLALTRAQIGAQKAGTQTFIDWIALHPQVRVARRELHFWDYGGRGRALGDYYRDLPLPRVNERTSSGLPLVGGEKTPRYAGEASPLALFQAFPQLRLIYLVRDPVARAFSHYLHLVSVASQFCSAHTSRARARAGGEQRRRAAQTWRGRTFPFRAFGDALRHSLVRWEAPTARLTQARSFTSTRCTAAATLCTCRGQRCCAACRHIRAPWRRAKWPRCGVVLVWPSLQRLRSIPTTC